MPQYKRIPPPNRFLFNDPQGIEREIRGLPLDQRDLWVFRYGEFRDLLRQEAEATPEIQFWQLYDEHLPNGDRNPDHNREFRRLTDQLLEMHGIKPGQVSADMAVALLISHDGDRPLLEILEFPILEPSEGEPGIEGDSTLLGLATLTTHTGNWADADAIASSRPWVEVEEQMRVSNELAKRSLKGSPASPPSPAQASPRTEELSRDAIARIQAEMKVRMDSTDDASFFSGGVRAAAHRFGPDAARAAIAKREGN